MVENIKLIFYIIPIVGALIKVFDDFFIQILKSKYKNEPGSIGTYGVIVKIIVGLLIASEVIVIIASIILICRGKNPMINKVDSIDNSLWGLITNIIFALMTINIIVTIGLFSIIQKKYINKLESIREKNYKKTNILIGKIKSVFWNNKVVKIVVKYNLKISYISLAANIFLLGFVGYCLNHNITKNEDVELLVTLNLVFLIGFIFITVLSNKYSIVMKEIVNDVEYIFQLNNSNEYIKTNLYLAYKDSYLIIKDGYEVWIPKSNITRRIIKLKK